MRWLDAALLLLLAVAALAPLAPLLKALLPSRQAALLRGVPAAWLPGVLLSAALLALAWLFSRLPAYRLPLLGFSLLLLRLGFDLYVFPARLATSPETAYRTAALRVGRETKGRPLLLWPNAQLDNVEAYYIARERGQTLATAPLPPRPGVLYLAKPEQLAGRNYRVLDEFTIDRGLVFRLVEFP